jgi:dethiobiotin synthetase
VRAYFVTGTDTSVGKTVVAAALLAAARKRGLTTAALKPAETGCPRDPSGVLKPADAAFLHQAAGTDGDPNETCLYAFAMPAAPAVAARAEDRAISVPAITRAVHARRGNVDLLLVEGAGGLLVPFTERHTAADLARILDLPLLVVARAGLGTINHSALTVESARGRGLHVTGIVLSAVDQPPDDPATSSNAAEIERLTGVPVLGRLPALESLDLGALADAAERHLDLDAILFASAAPVDGS